MIDVSTVLLSTRTCSTTPNNHVFVFEATSQFTISKISLVAYQSWGKITIILREMVILSDVRQMFGMGYHGFTESQYNREISFVL